MAEIILPSAPHLPVVIDGDAALAAFPNKTGSGTEGAPYVISNLEIDANGTGSCISIAHTSAHLVIQNCTLQGSGPEAGNGGVVVRHCTNVTIDNCTARDNAADGILVWLSSNITVSRSIIVNSSRQGIALNYSIFNVVEGNTLDSNGDGIWLSCANHDAIRDNVAVRNNQGIHLERSSYNEIANNTCNYNQDGISLMLFSCDNTITKNRASFNKAYGITMDTHSLHNTLEGNVAEGNGRVDVFGEAYHFTETVETALLFVITAFFTFFAVKYAWQYGRKNLLDIEKKLNAGYGLFFAGLAMGYSAFALDRASRLATGGVRLFADMAYQTVINRDYLLIAVVSIFLGMAYLIWVMEKALLSRRPALSWCAVATGALTLFLRPIEQLLLVTTPGSVGVPGYAIFLMLAVFMVWILTIFGRISRLAEKRSPLWYRSIAFAIGFFVFVIMLTVGNNQFSKSAYKMFPGFELLGPAISMAAMFTMNYGFLRTEGLAVPGGAGTATAPLATSAVDVAAEKRGRLQAFVASFTRPAAITEEEVTYFRQQKVCLVCKGKVAGAMFACPTCDALYCRNCSDALADLDNACWSCNAPIDPAKPVKPQAPDEAKVGLEGELESAGGMKGKMPTSGSKDDRAANNGKDKASARRLFDVMEEVKEKKT